jgi:hypothetical protein
MLPRLPRQKGLLMVKIVFSEIDVDYNPLVTDRILFEPMEIVYDSKKSRLWIVLEDRLMSEGEKLDYENRKVEVVRFDKALPDDAKIDFLRLTVAGGLNYLVYDKYKVIDS